MTSSGASALYDLGQHALEVTQEKTLLIADHASKSESIREGTQTGVQ